MTKNESGELWVVSGKWLVVSIEKDERRTSNVQHRMMNEKR